MTCYRFQGLRLYTKDAEQVLIDNFYFLNVQLKSILSFGLLCKEVSIISWFFLDLSCPAWNEMLMQGDAVPFLSPRWTHTFSDTQQGVLVSQWLISGKRCVHECTWWSCLAQLWQKEEPLNNTAILNHYTKLMKWKSIRMGLLITANYLYCALCIYMFGYTVCGKCQSGGNVCLLYINTFL